MRITNADAYKLPPAARSTISWARVTAITEVRPDIALFDPSKILTEEGR
ncbi:hypothetical protein [Streptomyces sp. NPDC005538]